MKRLAIIFAISLQGLLVSSLSFAQGFSLPSPKKMPAITKKLSLHEAVALALRNNPDIKIAKLQRIVDKFGLAVTIWQNYKLQWQPLALTGQLVNQSAPNWQFTTGVKVNAPSGTETSLNYANNLRGGIGQANLSITQHILKGFGFALNNIPYQDALDAEKIARLSFKSSVISVVVGVISNYRALVEADNNLMINEKALAAQEAAAKQSKERVKAGKMAQSDFLQQQANVESTRLSVVQQKEALRDSYQRFLSILGLATTTKLQIDRNIAIKTIHVPSEKETIALALMHNIAYQTALLNFQIAKRQLITDKDAQKWTLDLTGSVSLGRERALGSQTTTSLNTNPQLGLNFSIPFDDLSIKQRVVSDKVAIESAKLKLQQQKEDLIRQVENQWDSIKNQRHQVDISSLLVSLQAKTVNNAKLKLKYGKTTVFEVNSLVNSLLQSRTNLVSEKITYLNDVTTLYQTLGKTLEEWSIGLRY